MYSSVPQWRKLLIKIFSISLFICGYNITQAQQIGRDSLNIDSARFVTAPPAKPLPALSKQYDVADLIKDILHPHKPVSAVAKNPSGITVIPNIASNPTIGFQVGIKAVAGKKLGRDPSTLLSVAATSASITTKGIIYFYVNHNIYTNGNKWNLQGNLVFAKTVTPDYGLGIGVGAIGSKEAIILSDSARKGYALHSLYFNFREKVYKEIQKNLFLGAGVSFDVRRQIVDRKNADTVLTPYTIYNSQHGFNNGGYSSNGLFFNVQYTTRDNQNRAFKGFYADAGFRANQTWLGSTKNALQFTNDFRKYFSLSSRNPEHVIALWNWGSYLVTGNVPYLELPGSGKDGAFRSARGYTTGYFKGTKFNYSEIEYRFPITTNKFLSGVSFFNVQTSNNLQGINLFEHWQPGGGAGLRVLFNKTTRTNLCLDYAFGKFGSKGFFLGLNEAF